MQGLVIGKFMPLHEGHIALIKFAVQRCDQLIVLVCFDPSKQTMDGPSRYEWVKQTFADEPKIRVDYMDTVMPDSQESNREVSIAWAEYLRQRYPKLEVVFSSEKYGDYLAEYMGIKHIQFDSARAIVPISATMIRDNPVRHWDKISAAAKPFFVKRVCLYGPESCGKSTLTKKLAETFETTYVPEMAREVFTDPITGKERHCTYEDIYPIGILHAETILKRMKEANRVLFVDSDILTTQVYSEHYFGKVPTWPSWVFDPANQHDLYLLMTPEVPWVNDGTRDLGHIREEMFEKFKKALELNGIEYTLISGSSYETREADAVHEVNKLLGLV